MKPVSSGHSQKQAIVVGGGASGMMAAIIAARRGHRVVLLEKLPRLGLKLLATGGGRCNFANTLPEAAFMASFGREGKFLFPALKAMTQPHLCAFFTELGVASHAPDGFRVFPVTHEATSVVSALIAEIQRLNIEVHCSRRVARIQQTRGTIAGVSADGHEFTGDAVILATGGMGYPALGAEGDGHVMAAATGHRVTELFPGMLPLRTRETWVANCRADTIGKAEIRLNLPGKKSLKAIGDLIFTTDGIRGPVVLDFSREITPLLAERGEVPVCLNLTGRLNEEEIRARVAHEASRRPLIGIAGQLEEWLPRPLAREMCLMTGIDPNCRWAALPGEHRERLIKTLVATPLTIVGHEGFAAAMITRGGVSLRDIRPETLESRHLPGLYFCGELLNLDGPCGGFNLQWAFASGYLAGHLGELSRETPPGGFQRG